MSSETTVKCDACGKTRPDGVLHSDQAIGWRQITIEPAFHSEKHYEHVRRLSADTCSIKCTATVLRNYIGRSD